MSGVTPNESVLTVWMPLDGAINLNLILLQAAAKMIHDVMQGSFFEMYLC